MTYLAFFWEGKKDNDPYSDLWPNNVNHINAMNAVDGSYKCICDLWWGPSSSSYYVVMSLSVLHGPTFIILCKWLHLLFVLLHKVMKKSLSLLLCEAQIFFDGLKNNLWFSLCIFISLSCWTNSTFWLFVLATIYSSLFFSALGCYSFLCP